MKRDRIAAYEATAKLEESHLPTVAHQCAAGAAVSYLVARAVLIRQEVATTKHAEGSPARKRALKWALGHGYLKPVAGSNRGRDGKRRAPTELESVLSRCDEMLGKT